MIPEECSSIKNSSEVKLEESGRKIIFLNEARDTYKVVAIDGCCIKECIAADFLIIVQDVGNLIVELKGKDVDHGLKQVVETARKCIARKYATKPINALILARQCPRTNTIVQRAKNDLRKIAGGKLTLLSGNRREQFVSFV